ncbi:hypothetical protein HDG40_005651 [Paraburkholderia sp. JPY158]|uniref:MBL fold metallo-hydrolase n=1 Tax=Paraburkholderia atlantica TaxID=2654982 RepID=A0A7W8QBP9_PARAM|nr:hypothetical protein [Paraburkholderia atlantica]MBB5427472.1 hypothetical protein [Paraburkholderia atlantica]
MNQNTRNGFIKVVALPAGPGDCLWIEYGRDSEAPHVLIVDTGVSSTCEFIRPKLAALTAERAAVLVITHIDDDHIGSATKLLSDKSLTGKVADVWFNGRRHCGPEDKTESLGVKNAVALDELLGSGAHRWNHAFGGNAVSLDCTGAPRQLPEMPGGLQVTVLGPSKDQLLALGREWDRGVDRLLEKNRAAPPLADLPPDMEVFGSAVLDVPSLSSYIGEDSSVTNGSSISLLLEFDGRRIVLAADSHAASLLAAWKHLDISSIDLLKVSHHGSRNNTSLGLVEAMRPQRTLICSDASRHGHPDDECIAMLVAPVGHKRIFTNYTYEKLSSWDNDYMRRKHNFSVVSGDGIVEINL